MLFLNNQGIAFVRQNYENIKGINNREDFEGVAFEL